MNDRPELNDETDFRELIRKPRKLFGYSYIYFIVILSALGISYMENLTVIGKNSIAPTVIQDSSSFVQDIPYQSPSILPPVDVMKVSVSTPDLINRGRELFRTNCVACHGDNGEGDGPSSATLNPKPRNFHSLAGWTTGSKISQIYKTLQEGVPKTGMASFSFLPPADRFALIHFIRTLAPGQPTDTPQELQGLETVYQLSKGSNIPGQIPVIKALEIIEREEAPAIIAVTDLAKRRDESQNAPGLEVFDRVARNKERVIAGLLFNSDSSLYTIDRFMKTVTADPIQLGFKAGVTELSEPEWTALFKYMIELKARKD